MPAPYTPTPEHLAALGYAPDAQHDVPAAHLVGYSRRQPAPVHPWYATLVVQVRQAPDGRADIWLQRRARTHEYPWQGYVVPTPLFFEQLLLAVGWPVLPDETPENYPLTAPPHEPQ